MRHLPHRVGQLSGAFRGQEPADPSHRRAGRRSGALGPSASRQRAARRSATALRAARRAWPLSWQNRTRESVRISQFARSAGGRVRKPVKFVLRPSDTAPVPVGIEIVFVSGDTSGSLRSRAGWRVKGSSWGPRPYGLRCLRSRCCCACTCRTSRWTWCAAPARSAMPGPGDGVMGGAVSWGTSLWAALLFTLLARHGALELSHDPALLIACWLVIARHRVRRLRCGFRHACRLARLARHQCRPRARPEHVRLPDAGLAAAGQPVGLAVGAVVDADRCRCWRPARLLVCFIMSSEGLLRLKPWQVRLAPFLAGGALMTVLCAGGRRRGLVRRRADARAACRPRMRRCWPASPSILALAVTRFMSRIERHLVDRADGLEQSLRKANSDLQKIAYYDALTKLPNRLVFEDKLLAAVGRVDQVKSRLAVLFIDLDGFKPINDSFGHSSGDAVLRQVGERLRSLSRSADTMARVGGDEFLMLLEGDADEQSAAQVATRMLATLERAVLDRQPRGRGLGVDRHRLLSRRRLADQADRARRCRDVRGQALRRRLLLLLRAEHGGRCARPARPAARPAPRAREQGARAVLPAEGRRADRQGHGGRGAAALEAPEARA